jgi:uncharacterized protein
MINNNILQTNKTIDCRMGCAACCIAPSISSPIPGMANGKPAGLRCIQLTDDNRCSIFGLDTRPAVCTSIKPTNEMCGKSNSEAFEFLEKLEIETLPYVQ